MSASEDYLSTDSLPRIGDETESFAETMESGPDGLTRKGGCVICCLDDYNHWCARLVGFHAEELREAKAEGSNDATIGILGGGLVLDGLTDDFLLEHGLVRLPRDADGTVWTGEERFFQDAQVGGARFLFGLSYFGDGKWEIIDHYQNEVGAAPAMCRHVPDVTADQHAELADELDTFASMCVPDKDAVSKLKDIADRLRELGVGVDE